MRLVTLSHVNSETLTLITVIKQRNLDSDQLYSDLYSMLRTQGGWTRAELHHGSTLQYASV